MMCVVHGPFWPCLHCSLGWGPCPSKSFASFGPGLAGSTCASPSGLVNSGMQAPIADAKHSGMSGLVAYTLMPALSILDSARHKRTLQYKTPGPRYQIRGFPRFASGQQTVLTRITAANEKATLRSLFRLHPGGDGGIRIASQNPHEHWASHYHRVAHTLTHTPKFFDLHSGILPVGPSPSAARTDRILFEMSQPPLSLLRNFINIAYFVQFYDTLSTIVSLTRVV